MSAPALLAASLVGPVETGVPRPTSGPSARSVWLDRLGALKENGQSFVVSLPDIAKTPNSPGALSSALGMGAAYLAAGDLGFHIRTRTRDDWRSIRIWRIDNPDA